MIGHNQDTLELIPKKTKTHTRCNVTLSILSFVCNFSEDENNINKVVIIHLLIKLRFLNVIETSAYFNPETTLKVFLSAY